VIRVILPAPLRTLARLGPGELELEVDGPVTVQSVIDVLEARFPALLGTIRDPATRHRRPFIRYFACERDLSHDSPEAPLPEAVVSGKEPLIVLGAIAGG
jgi:molybdopterin synthase sulfur carrier subunit